MITGKNKKASQKKQPFETGKKLERLKTLIVVVKKGHGTPVSNLILDEGASMTTLFFAFGTKQTYVADIFGGEEQNKEAILAIVPEHRYRKIRLSLESYFATYRASQGIALIFDVSSLAGVVAYKFLADYEGADKYADK